MGLPPLLRSRSLDLAPRVSADPRAGGRVVNSVFWKGNSWLNEFLVSSPHCFSLSR
jgi:hypothetical protein